ncbi:hypothetical protein [Nitrososphaera viennensis]|uniref:Uncharacterized protein n=2 Tax=Nitrososphaera viennensis TaxID=1034015 RepID=A0A060HR93_9ARCH|nr:hypothetical protein [Nitrososphaera viennensis]AIC15707.1 hypothetical protein NVIE_014660 [Nitrososphaera viennensis EN76]UVS70580.1 hypothetical protein NWT39_07280 [Nitrososphaera viennensis]
MTESETTMQMVLNRNRITVSITMFGGGVLVTRVFEGSGCYDQLVDFLKSQFGIGSVIRSSIIIADDR